MDLFNTKKRKTAETVLRNSISEYEHANEDINAAVLGLYETRKAASETTDKTEEDLKKKRYVKSEYIIEIADKKAKIRNFRDSVEKEEFALDSSNPSAGVALAGTAVGAAIATLGPTAAMALATTFGTAATGTAISALSGAAATNAALAFLGGGAIAAGGAGMAGGAALLAAIPIIGWSIGGAAAVGGGVLFAKKNAKITKTLDEQNESISEATRQLRKAENNIRVCEERIIADLTALKSLVENLSDDSKLDSDIHEILRLIDSLCDNINKKITL